MSRRASSVRASSCVDLVYNPPITPLLEAARRAGASTANGECMLVHQAMKAFEIWTGRTPSYRHHALRPQRRPGMRGKGLSHGAGTIVNAIATGRGAAFGVDLRTEAEVELDSSGIIDVRIEGFEGEGTELAERCVRNVLAKMAKEEGYGAKVTTRSQIPISRGLKSSSAAANAIVLATLDALGVRGSTPSRRSRSGPRAPSRPGSR